MPHKLPFHSVNCNRLYRRHPLGMQLKTGLLYRYFREEAAKIVSLLDELPPFLYTAAI